MTGGLNQAGVDRPATPILADSGAIRKVAGGHIDSEVRDVRLTADRYSLVR